MDQKITQKTVKWRCLLHEEKYMSVRSEHSTLLFPFGSLTTHFCYYVVWNTFFDSFSNIFFVELSHTSGVTVTQQGFYNVYPLSPSERSTLILSFESLLTRSYNYYMWTATYFFCLFFTHFISEIVLFFLRNHYTRKL